MMLCYAFLFTLPFPTFLAMCWTKRQQSCHCFTEPIHYSVLPKGAWLVTGSLSSATESLDSGPSILQMAAASCSQPPPSQPPPSSFHFCTLCCWPFPSVRVRFRILVALPATSFSSAFLAILYPTSWWKFWGFQAVTMLLHCQRMPRAFFSTWELEFCLSSLFGRHRHWACRGQPWKPPCLLLCSCVFQRLTLLCLLPAASVELAGQASPKLTAWLWWAIIFTAFLGPAKCVSVTSFLNSL